MILADMIAILFLALILSSVLTWGFGWRHPGRHEPLGPSLLFLFLLMGLAMWAGGAWIPLWGPVWAGMHVVDFLIIGLFVSLLVLAVATPAKKPKTPIENVEEIREAEAVGTIFGVFFWILIFGFIMVGLLSYWRG